MNNKKIYTVDQLKSVLPASTVSYAYYCAPRSHSSLLFSIGRAIPQTKAQLKKFSHLDVLSIFDAKLIDSIMQKHGKQAQFVTTKTKQFCRLINFDDFRNCLVIDIK
jgi:hypothetical protein